MKLVHQLQKLQPVFFDTAIFIYLFENHSLFAAKLQSIFDALSTNNLIAISSVITLAEVITKPLQDNNVELVNRYKEIFSQLPNFTLVAPSYETAIQAAEIRALSGFSLIDSFQLALASEHNCKSFLSNDKKLARCKKIKIVLL